MVPFVQEMSIPCTAWLKTSLAENNINTCCNIRGLKESLDIEEQNSLKVLEEMGKVTPEKQPDMQCGT